MFFPFQCQKCKKEFDGEYPIGKAPRVTTCASCGGDSKRVYTGMSIAVSIDGVTCRTSKFGEQMRKKNDKAANKMMGNRPGVRLRGYEHADGRVSEAH